MADRRRRGTAHPRPAHAIVSDLDDAWRAVLLARKRSLCG